MYTYNQIAGQRIGRIEALSDGVFAIAMTILVFDLKDPIVSIVNSDKELLKSILEMEPKFLSYFLSFMTLGIFWTGQTTQFHYIEKYDRNINWITLFFLLFISLIPFSTNILSNHITNKISVLIYWLNILALGIIIYIHWMYAYKHHYVTSDETIHKAIQQRIIVAQSLYALGTLLCLISTYISIAFIIAIQLNYAFGFIDFSKRK